MDSSPTIRDLYPTLNEAQLKEAEENLDRYLALSIRMYERIRNDPVEYARFKKLTTKAEDLKIEGDKL